MRVLLADHQPQVRSALRLLLEHELGIHRIDEVGDIQSLRAQIQATPPDLILLDWELPGLSSLDLFSVLRDCCPGLLVIALSVHGEARRMALAAGADAFVSKGESPECLLTILDIMIYGGLVKMKRELVKDWMSSEVITIPHDMNLPEVHHVMTERQIRRLPVVENGQLVGIVTLGDVRQAEPSDISSLRIWEANYVLARLKVEKIMTRNPITISPEAAISQAAQVMLEKKISGLPVVDSKGQLVGIITESDIFRAVAQKWSQIEKLVG
jgi:CBS domain-containing protein